ncbi:hypothetical protein [Clostridium paraputrificum]|uniref:hypothetical protein n=1 Tax=Clostridium paraputrificum TaxID=29363 RepID=UPI002481448E|nr:hypothetical protein [Clostridium paraputrificum]MDB2085885.1 hypothetical protein [Clostridium paraputrificum]
MFEYTFPAVEGLHINTPKVDDFSEVKVKVIEQTPTKVHSIAEYPNGVIFETISYIDKLVVRCNHEIIDNHDGTYTVT